MKPDRGQPEQKHSLWQRLSAPFVEPYSRYQHADILHAMRLGVAVVAALLFNKVSQLPHGEWTTITVFIILGLLQYQGAIYTKAKERVIGTLLGILVGLFLVWLSQGLGDYLWLYYALIGLISGVIGYYAVKQLGYIGLLTGITMCMIVSHTAGEIGVDGVYRALNVLIGTLIAVLATLILPLKSTLMWRFLLASNLEACGDIYVKVGAHITKSLEPSPDRYTPLPLHALPYRHHYTSPMIEADHSMGLDQGVPIGQDMVASLKQINKRLLASRPHLAATSRESGIDQATLEHIQRTHRNIIGTVDLLLTAAPRLAEIGIDADNRELLTHYQHELTQAMRHMAAVLRSPNNELFRPITRIQVAEYPSVQHLTFEWQGYFWLTQNLQAQLQSLSDLLQQTEPQWFAASGLRYQRREQRRIHAQGGESELDI
jgi:hypothetical protein